MRIVEEVQQQPSNRKDKDPLNQVAEKSEVAATTILSNCPSSLIFKSSFSRSLSNLKIEKNLETTSSR